MNSLTVSAFIICLYPLLLSTYGRWNCASKNIHFWLSMVLAFLLGIYFTSNAYHIGNAYMSILSGPSILLIIGLVWSALFCISPLLVVKCATGSLKERLILGLAFSTLTFLVGVIPSIPVIVLLSLA